MLASMACFACMSIVIRILSHEMHPTLMVFLRNIMSFLMIIGWTAAMQRRAPRFPTTRMRSHFWRAAIGLVAMELWFYSLSVMQVTLATALSFTTPIFSTIFAILFLGETAGRERWLAVIAGFIGVLVILRPDVSSFEATALVVLLSSAMMGVAGVLVKSLTRTESPETIIYYMSLFMLILSAPPALLHWQEITPHQWWLVFLIALFSTAAHLFITRAYVRADMVVLMPFDFTRLIIVAILAHIFFAESITLSTLVGAGVIVASTVYTARREARSKAAALTAASKV